MYCIETTNLSHRFSGEAVLRDINLRVPEGSIYGFLGANGAGKTTTLRLLLGLLRPQTGHIRIFGQPPESGRTALLKKIGSLIEAPSIYAHLTAAENLEVWRRVWGCPKARIGAVLKTVGLAGTGSKRAGRFSLGMKQRLGLAVALLNDPTLLILDEPVNGLDPAGIIEMRELLKDLNRERGMTILLSSHILPELEKVATHAGILHGGELLVQGGLEALRQQARKTVCFDTSDPAATHQVLLAEGLRPVAEAGGLVTVPAVDPEALARINAQLLRSGISIYNVHATGGDLESLFMTLTRKTTHEHPAQSVQRMA